MPLRMASSLKKVPNGGEPVMASKPITHKAPVTGRTRSVPRVQGGLCAEMGQRVAGGEKQHGLGDGVIHGVQHAAEPGNAADADPKDEDAHVLDAGIGQQPLEIHLPDHEQPRHGDERKTEEHEQVPAEGAEPCFHQEGMRGEWEERRSLSRTPDRRADTTEGASLCASGSQVCSGAKPILVP